MKTRIDINQWNRKEHYLFFKGFDEPFYGLTANVDVSRAYRFAKENKLSFFVYYLFACLKTVNNIKEFRYRIEEDELYCYDVIHASATIDRGNGTFGFSFIEYTDDFEQFALTTKKEIQRVKKLDSFELFGKNNVVHITTLPWFSFTSLSHPRNYNTEECIPKISFGKFYEENGKLLMPVAVHAHHALIDGYHVGQFYRRLQTNLEQW